MTDCNTPTIPPYDSHTKVASSPLQYPLHPPSQTHPHTPKGCAPALRGGARPLIAIRSAMTTASTRSDMHKRKKPRRYAETFSTRNVFAVLTRRALRNANLPCSEHCQAISLGRIRLDVGFLHVVFPRFAECTLHNDRCTRRESRRPTPLKCCGSNTSEALFADNREWRMLS